MENDFFRLFVDTVDTLTKEQGREVANALSSRGFTPTVRVPDPPPTLTMPGPGPATSHYSKVAMAASFKAGERVMLTAPISPKYLDGVTGTVAAVNGSVVRTGRTRVSVNVKLDAKTGRFGGRSPIGIPVNCLKRL